MKKPYKTPKVISVGEKINGGVPGALLGAAYMIGRAVTAAVKGHIDLKAETEKNPKTLQQRG